MISDLRSLVKGFKENSFCTIQKPAFLSKSQCLFKMESTSCSSHRLRQLRTAHPIRAAAVSRSKERFVITPASDISVASLPAQQKDCMPIKQNSRSCSPAVNVFWINCSYQITVIGIFCFYIFLGGQWRAFTLQATVSEQHEENNYRVLFFIHPILHITDSFQTPH